MVFLLSDSLFQMFQFLTRALDLVARGFQLLAVHQRPGARKPAAGPPGDRERYSLAAFLCFLCPFSGGLHGLRGWPEDVRRQ